MQEKLIVIRHKQGIHICCLFSAWEINTGLAAKYWQPSIVKRKFFCLFGRRPIVFGFCFYIQKLQLDGEQHVKRELHQTLKCMAKRWSALFLKCRHPFLFPSLPVILSSLKSILNHPWKIMSPLSRRKRHTKEKAQTLTHHFHLQRGRFLSVCNLLLPCKVMLFKK